MPTRFPSIRMLGSLLVISIIIAPALGQSGISDNSNSKRFILDIYPDRAGDALVIGYADNLKSIKFLNNSEYTYNNNTRQLVARTNVLTRKDEDLWTLRFGLLDHLNEYYTAFYLPSDVKLRGVNISEGLKYLISTRNESLVVEIQGYDVQDPVVTIEYRQPFLKADEKTNFADIYIFIVMMLLALGIAFLIIERREGVRRTNISETDRVDNSAKSIEITKELDAVMHTLTENELTVLRALLSHGGSITQLDLRYKTNTPKSSLSDILLSLERRKIITKKELGRTNLIQLSEKFLSKEDHLEL
ncbi:MAG TPA: hypothetical protein VLY86_02895 [Methanothrix sp.]|nr:hypothetical protein [Methanothrix sp.]